MKRQVTLESSEATPALGSCTAASQAQSENQLPAPRHTPRHVPTSAHVRFAASQTHLRCCKPHAAHVHPFAALLICDTVGFFDTRNILVSKETNPPLKKGCSMAWRTWQQHAPPIIGAIFCPRVGWGGRGQHLCKLDRGDARPIPDLGQHSASQEGAGEMAWLQGLGTFTGSTYQARQDSTALQRKA